MTVDEAIAALTRLKTESKLGGDTCLAVCLLGSGIADSNVNYFHLDQSEGSTVYVIVTDHELKRKA